MEEEEEVEEEEEEESYSPVTEKETNHSFYIPLSQSCTSKDIYIFHIIYKTESNVARSRESLYADTHSEETIIHIRVLQSEGSRENNRCRVSVFLSAR